MIKQLIKDRNSRRWIIPVALVGLGFSAYSARSNYSPESVVLIGGGIAILALELLLTQSRVLRPRRCCPRCNCLCDAELKECPCCGRAWLKEPGMFYPLEVWAIPAVARKARRARITAAVAAISIAALVYGIFHDAVLAVVAAASCCTMLIRVANVFALKSTSELLKSHSGTLCQACLYPLDRSMNICPECGQPGTEQSSRWAWARTGLGWPRGSVCELMKADQEGRERSLRAGPATGARGGGFF